MLAIVKATCRLHKGACGSTAERAIGRSGLGLAAIDLGDCYCTLVTGGNLYVPSTSSFFG